MKKKKKRLKKKVKRAFRIIFLIILLSSLGVLVFYYYTSTMNLTQKKEEHKDYYTIYDFGFITPISDIDYNKDGIDDSTAIFNGAKEYASFNPKYVSNYYDGGYPPVEKEGVCTDLIWYSIKNAGYDLKSLISKDIDITKKKNTYNIETKDDNIDFRRVNNQEIFFQRYAEILDTDYTTIGSFMPGDILTFDNSDHIAMVSDKLNKKGIPYLIQNRGEEQKEKEEDRIEKTDMKITGHYRFTYSKELQELIDQL